MQSIGMRHIDSKVPPAPSSIDPKDLLSSYPTSSITKKLKLRNVYDATYTFAIQRFRLTPPRNRLFYCLVCLVSLGEWLKPGVGEGVTA